MIVVAEPEPGTDVVFCISLGMPNKNPPRPPAVKNAPPISKPRLPLEKKFAGVGEEPAAKRNTMATPTNIMVPRISHNPLSIGSFSLVEFGAVIKNIFISCLIFIKIKTQEAGY